MDYAWFLFDFEGRINRAKYWLAALIIICWMLFLSTLVLGTAKLFGGRIDEFGFDTDDIFRAIDPSAYHSAVEIIRNGKPTSPDNLIPMSFHAIGTPLFLWVYLATSIKRLHDRNKSAWWMVPFFIVPGLFGEFQDRLPHTYPVMALALGTWLICIWAFVEMCCLPGTTGPNRFGTDPVARPDASPRWDQQSELELVPHRAGVQLSEAHDAPRLRMSESSGP
jgi:uncharacterized membrane protein YhaH (DUF805 family)